MTSRIFTVDEDENLLPFLLSVLCGEDWEAIKRIDLSEHLMGLFAPFAKRARIGPGTPSEGLICMDRTLKQREIKVLR